MDLKTAFQLAQERLKAYTAAQTETTTVVEEAATVVRSQEIHAW